MPGNFLHDILAVDLDGDGVREIVAPRGAAYLGEDHELDGLVLYRRKPGKGTVSFERIPMRGPNGPVRPVDFSLASGDLDRDGFADVVQFRSVWLNPGGKIQDPWEGFLWTEHFAPSSLAVEDMDGDGRLDIVFTEGHSHRVGRSRVGIWFNEGVSRKRARGTVEVLRTVDQDPENLAVADLDGNGIPDIVTGAMNWRRAPGDLHHPSWNDTDGTVVIFAGRPGGRRPEWVSFTLRKETAAFHHLSLADLNGDGRLDILGENAGVASPPAKVTPSVQVLLRR